MTDTPRIIAPTDTDRVLADMLTENTGRHMLDSGGAYGRAWERNAGHGVEDFLAAPPVTASVSHGYLDVTLDVFHWLRERLDYDARMDEVFQRWVSGLGNPDPDPDRPWLAEAELFAAAVKGQGYTRWQSANRYHADDLDMTINSYNHECSLSQTIQFVTFTRPRDDESFVLLQIHGGCDVRGGYTTPKVFRVPGGYDGICDLLTFDAYTLGCTREEPQADALPDMPHPVDHYLDYRGGDWTGSDGGYLSRDPWTDDTFPMAILDTEGDPTGEIGCPYCGAPMVAYTYPVG